MLHLNFLQIIPSQQRHNNKGKTMSKLINTISLPVFVWMHIITLPASVWMHICRFLDTFMGSACAVFGVFFGSLIFKLQCKQWLLIGCGLTLVHEQN